MAAKKLMWIVLGILIIAAWPLGSVPQAKADTLNYKLFNHVTKRESSYIPDAEGHAVALTMREGVVLFENGELAWVNAVSISDTMKGVGTFDQYVTLTLPDGSAIVTRTKGKIEATPAGVQTSAQWHGEIIHGKGRFQGIKGTVITSGKLLPPEKGGAGAKGSWRGYS